MQHNYLSLTTLVRYSFLLVFICLQSISTSAQTIETEESEDVPTYSTNNYSVYANYGTVIFASQMSISLERKIWEYNNFKTKAKFTYGNYISNHFDCDLDCQVDENNFSLAAVQLISLLELNGGLGLVTYTLTEPYEPDLIDPNVNYDDKKIRVDFYGSIGMRFESENYLFRFGLGNLEYLYIGVGFNF